MAAIVAVTALSGTAQADVGDEEMIVGVAEPLEVLSGLAEDQGNLGVYQTDDEFTVLVPLDDADLLADVQAELDTALDAAGLGDLVYYLELSQFTTADVDELGEVLGSREETGITDEYTLANYYEPETDTYHILTDAPADVTAPLVVDYPGMLSFELVITDALDGRYDDATPFSGAASVTSGGQTCTTTVGVRAASQAYMLTAAHCFPLNATVIAKTGAGKVGVVEYRNSTRDSELISDVNDLDVTPHIWTGGTAASTSHIAVAGPRIPRKGMKNVYGSGQTTFNRNRGSVKATGVNWCPKGVGCIITGKTGFMVSGGTSTLGGDSGAPLFQVTTANKAAVVGLLSGRMVTASTTYMVASSMPSLLSGWGVALATG